MIDELVNEAGRDVILNKYISETGEGKPWVVPADLLVKVEQLKPLSLNDLALNDAMQLDKRTVAAIIHRNDDIEEKWIVVPQGMKITKEEIQEQVYFQEQYFNSFIEMLI